MDDDVKLTTDRVDAIDVLVGQHAHIRRLMRLVAANDGHERAGAFLSMAGALERHEYVEQQVVHALARRLPDAGPLVAQLIADEHRIDTTLASLRRMGVRSPAFTPLFTELQRAVTAHIEHEEGHEFPLLRDHLNAASMAGLVRALETAGAR